MSRFVGRTVGNAAVCVLVCLLAASALPSAQQDPKPFEPVEGQAGKDVPWVPTPDTLVEKMLDIAKVTPQDFVIDLGSGDGRNVIAAARRGATALGVEYNPDLVELSKQRAAEAGVGAKAQFVEGDMYLADISKASVLALFLLPQNMLRLREKFLALTPGSRIVSNTFSIEGWDPDYSEIIPNCAEWCTVFLWVVPANVEGVWKTPAGDLTLTQQYQKFSGTLAGSRPRPVDNGRIRGDQVSFTLAGNTIEGRVAGDRFDGTVTTNGKPSSFSATRTKR
jgi:SAM-dependent methyltransferase